MGLDVLDKIAIEIETDGAVLTDAVTQFKDYISTETQAVLLDFKDTVADATVVEVDDIKVNVRIEVRTQKESEMKIGKYLLITLLVVVIDQTSKLLVHKYMYLHEEVNVIGNWFRLHYC